MSPKLKLGARGARAVPDRAESPHQCGSDGSLECVGWRTGLKKVSLTTFLEGHGYRRSQAFAMTNELLDGRRIVIELRGNETPEKAAQRLREIGVATITPGGTTADANT